MVTAIMNMEEIQSHHYPELYFTRFHCNMKIKNRRQNEPQWPPSLCSSYTVETFSPSAHFSLKMVAVCSCEMSVSPL